MSWAEWPDAALPCRRGRWRLGSRRLQQQRDRAQHPEGDDPVRHDKDSTTSGFALRCRICSWHGRDGKCLSARAYALRALVNWLDPTVKRTGKSLEELEQVFLSANRPTSIIMRFASTEEVANMVVYVCSQQASATTGAALRVDGGGVWDPSANGPERNQVPTPDTRSFCILQGPKNYADFVTRRFQPDVSGLGFAPAN